RCIPGSEELPLRDSSGRVLAEPFFALLDSPQFDNSAVDGYGVRIEETPGLLTLAGRSEAGGATPGEQGKGGAIRILTGAPVPTGVGAVVMQEDCRVWGDRVEVLKEVSGGENIRCRGEEYRTGDLLLPADTLLTPSAIGVLASNGRTHAVVRRLPRVTVISTGQELTAAGETLGSSAIYDSNGPALSAALSALGLSAETIQVNDDPEATARTFETALGKSDLLLTTGGISVGDRDLVRDALARCGVEELFWRVSIKPGKPVFCGRKGGGLVLGLPGNPVSALVTYLLFARPALLQMMGISPQEGTIAAPLSGALVKRGGRAEFVRALLEQSPTRVTPIEKRGSHMLGGLAGANCLIRLPLQECSFGEGDVVEVMPIRWGVA
ncbi:MAG TPA: gephyrin-like molybdotransferase Glp, partial [Fimbriimonadaceae bacterium]|nr:gephyrin-like molybdotransferase Glp [Fimbriimonadaceae bacterium]